MRSPSNSTANRCAWTRSPNRCSKSTWVPSAAQGSTSRRPRRRRWTRQSWDVCSRCLARRSLHSSALRPRNGMRTCSRRSRTSPRGSRKTTSSRTATNGRRSRCRSRSSRCAGGMCVRVMRASRSATSCTSGCRVSSPGAGVRRSLRCSCVSTRCGSGSMRGAESGYRICSMPYL